MKAIVLVAALALAACAAEAPPPASTAQHPATDQPRQDEAPVSPDQ